MPPHQKQSLSQRFRQYEASKTVLVWACGGAAVLAIVVGFTWGGWVTGGSAQAMADAAAAQARQELAAVVCVDRFLAASDASAQLVALKAIASPHGRGKFVEEGGWAMILPASVPADRQARADDRNAATLCAAELTTREIAASGRAAQITEPVGAAQ
jgi:hypothetical protein